ncbi:MAG: hypothetical protein AAGM40_23005, partial [Cyanobacteria bacterium J06573_2]
INLPPGKTPLSQLDSQKMWLISSKGSNYDAGTRIPTPNTARLRVDKEVNKENSVRVIYTRTRLGKIYDSSPVNELYR